MAFLTLNGTKTKLNELLNDADNSTWTDTEKTNFITAAVFFLSRGRRPKLWTEVENTTLTTTQDQDTYTIPAGIFAIAEIWMEDSINSTPPCFSLTRKWRAWAGSFRFAKGYIPSETGRTIRLKAIKKYTSITEVVDEYEDIVLDYAMFRAFTDLSNHTTLLNTYVAKLQGVSRNDIQIRAREHKQNAELALRENARPLPPAYATIGEV